MIVGMALHLPFCLLFVNYFDMGIYGLGVASSCKDLIGFIVVIVYGQLTPKIRRCLRPFDREAFRGWGEYLAISLPSTGMICAEMWGLQVLTIIAGTLGVAEQGSQALCSIIGAVLFMAPVGVQEATCAIIGNCVGANNVPLAKHFFWLILKINSVLVLLISSLVFFGRYTLIKFFT